MVVRVTVISQIHCQHSQIIGALNVFSRMLQPYDEHGANATGEHQNYRNEGQLDNSSHDELPA
jgi:hypothetical protein